MPELRIATRQSPLAMWQAEYIKTQLQHHWPDLSIRLVPMTTSGDRFLQDTLSAIGGKGLFVKELERAILEGEADIAVHSLKDVPAHLPEGLELCTFVEREDPRDALVSAAESLARLPEGAIIGTASLRRTALIKHHFPHLQVEVLRGNINSRLAKADTGPYAGIILAMAGLKRLGLENKIRTVLPIDTFIPAVGQGVLALECRTDAEAIKRYLAPLHHPDTAVCIQAERAFNERLGGACHVPVAGHATIHAGLVSLTGLVASTDGRDYLRAQASAPLADAEHLGRELAERLLAQGAAAILTKAS